MLLRRTAEAVARRLFAAEASGTGLSPWQTYVVSKASRIPPLASWIVTRFAEDPSVPQSRSARLLTPRWPSVQNMGVDHRGFHIARTEQFLNRMDVGALLK